MAEHVLNTRKTSALENANKSTQAYVKYNYFFAIANTLAVGLRDVRLKNSYMCMHFRSIFFFQCYFICNAYLPLGKWNQDKVVPPSYSERVSRCALLQTVREKKGYRGLYTAEEIGTISRQCSRDRILAQIILHPSPTPPHSESQDAS